MKKIILMTTPQGENIAYESIESVKFDLLRIKISSEEALKLVDEYYLAYPKPKPFQKKEYSRFIKFTKEIQGYKIETVPFVPSVVRFNLPA